MESGCSLLLLWFAKEKPGYHVGFGTKDFKFFQWGLIITVSKTKTIQFQERSLMISISRRPDKDLCAVHWCERHFSEIIVDKDSPAFQGPFDENNYMPFSFSVPMTAKAVWRKSRI